MMLSPIAIPIMLSTTVLSDNNKIIVKRDYYCHNIIIIIIIINLPFIMIMINHRGDTLRVNTSRGDTGLICTMDDLINTGDSLYNGGRGIILPDGKASVEFCSGNSMVCERLKIIMNSFLCHYNSW